jgi:hypothetical protein
MTPVSNLPPNWLADAFTAIQANAVSGGMLGALQAAKNKPGSIKTFLKNSASAADAVALIAQNSVADMGALAAQIASAQAKQAKAAKLAAEAARLSAPRVVPTNTLDPIIFFADGSTIDTNANILTMANGVQINTVTGTRIVDTSAIINLANGSYLDTKNNILTLPDGTRIDTVTGLILSTTA